MKVLKVADIIQDDIDEIQRVYYELQGYQNILKSILHTNDPDYDYRKNDIYKEYISLYQNKNTEYNLLFEELTAIYAGDMELPKDAQTTVDFRNGQLIIFIEDKHHGCGCKHEVKPLEE